MDTNDKDAWDWSYAEECFGLHNGTHTWKYITETEYQQFNQHMGHAFPTIALATIKPDEYGRLQQAKYYICVLGNLDPNDWSKTKCFAPVMSQLKMQLLVASAVHMECTVKG
eukprot:6327175-Ditylum_brightwellii.AAC.1